MKIGLAVAIGNSHARDMKFAIAMAQGIEAVGFDSMWFPEHVVFFDAEDYQSEYPYTDDGSPPWKDAMGVYDPLMAIACVSQHTTRLRFATSVMILPQRPALATAKEVMTLDHITGGRFDFGVGAGWSAEEYNALGVPFEHRGTRFNEYIKAIKAAWASPRSSFEGKYVSYKNAVMLPPPVTPGGPPFLIGGDSEAALRRAAQLGDGWYGWWKKYELADQVEKLREQLRLAGRENDPSFSTRVGIPFDGTPDQLGAKVEEARKCGIEEFVISVPISSKSLDRDLETWASAAGITAGIKAA
jgi:probable F420-dependent oxidoreductase